MKGMSMFRHGIMRSYLKNYRETDAGIRIRLILMPDGKACCLCSENDHCGGCNSGDCPGTGFCENRPCSMDKGIGHCYECNEECKKGMLTKIKPYGFFNVYQKIWGAKSFRLS